MRIRKVLTSGLLFIAVSGLAGPPALIGTTPTDESRSAEKRVARPAGRKRANTHSRFAGEPISLDLKDADLKDVLKTFAVLAKINIAIDPEVKGLVTIRLHDVPWDQALDVILRINGFGYVLEGNILRVGAPARLLSGS